MNSSDNSPGGISDAAQLLRDLAAKGVELWAEKSDEDEKLRCRAKKGVLTPALLERVQENKAALLRLLRERASGDGEAPRTPEEIFPLSHGQSALWFMYELAPESPAYNIMCVLRLADDLDVAALERAASALVARHSSLRTTYTHRGGAPLQRVRAEQPGHFEIVDADAGRRDWHTWAMAEAARPFDLEKGPVLRMHLRRGPVERATEPAAGAGSAEAHGYVLLFVIHHIAADLVSLRVLLEDLGILYKALRQGAPLPAGGSSYRSYVAWEAEHLRAHGERLASYWRRQLAGDLPTLNLPVDRPRPPVQTYAGREHPFELDAALVCGLRKVASGHGVTLYMTMLAAFEVLLHRYTGQDDIVIGTPVDNRSGAEFERTVGYSVNPLVLRIQVTDEMSIAQLFQRVRETLLGALEHQAYPFPLLVEKLQPARDPSRSPIFQVEFVWDQFLKPAWKTDRLIRETLLSGQRGAEFDLSLTIFAMDDTLRGSFRYNTDLFEPATVARMAGHFQTLLSGIVENPDGPIATLPMLTAAERHQLMDVWNDTASDIPRDTCFQQLFEAQVQRTPLAVAAVLETAGNEGAPLTLTYAELNQRANRLSRVLEERGVRTGVIVAVLAARSLDFLTAILAIFKAGGVYLPLDPLQPGKRLGQVLHQSLQQSEPSLVLTTPDFAPLLEDAGAERTARPHVLTFEAAWAASADRGEAQNENPAASSTPDDLAYIIFTSGSTGTPKGAMVEHKGMLNHLLAKVSALKLCSTDIIAQNAPQTFDISVWQFLVALLVGGQTCIMDDEIARDPRLLCERSFRRGVTILEVVPSLLQFMLDEVRRSPSDLSSLRWLVPTGEALLPNLARRWFEHYPHIPMLNAYGPTECSDDVTHHPIYQPPGAEIGHLPIGRPIPNMRMYILDSRLQPVPVGVPGELYVAGVGVGRGYLNEPERTEKAFIPSPFPRESRLYRTGDRVRYLPNGDIVFLGRIDHQVKLRGFRIELGEIETVLGRHPEVDQAVVLALKDQNGAQRLVAYVVCGQGGAPSPAGLRSFIEERLPAYMVPAAFVLLDAFPLTSSGKIDRNALPVPDVTSLAAGHEHAPPRTPTEETIAGIYRDVLRLPEVGVHHDFFELGGHSLLATQVVARVREVFQVAFPLRLIFEESTVAKLAARVEDARLAQSLKAAPSTSPPTTAQSSFKSAADTTRQNCGRI
jgi:amino acid adenylation domain-containing protein